MGPAKAGCRLHGHAGANTWWQERFDASQLLTDSQTVATLDYRAIEVTSVRSTVSFVVQRSGTAHGVGLWFDTILFEGAAFSNAPDEPDTIYGRAFFPLFEPIAVEVGDAAHVLVAASLVGGEYVWHWKTTFRRGEDTIASFSQSTVLGLPLSQTRLRRVSPEYTPELDSDGETLRAALALMDGRLTSAQIATRLAQRFPERYSGNDEALEYVVGLAQKHGR